MEIIEAIPQILNISVYMDFTAPKRDGNERGHTSDPQH